MKKISTEQFLLDDSDLGKLGLPTGSKATRCQMAHSTPEKRAQYAQGKNIPFDEFSELTTKFYQNGLPTYTEIIRGLPAETLESFKKGLESIVSDTKIDSIQIYNCSVLPNAPLNEPSYRKKHGIQTIKSPIYLAHSSIHNRGIDEFEYIIYSCKSFTIDELKEMFLYSWLVLTFYSLGILEYISKYYNKEKQLSYMKFFELFLDFCRKKNSAFSDVYLTVKKHIDDGYAGEGWNHYEPELGEIYYPIEEATWLKLTNDSNVLQQNIILFVKYLEEKLNFNSSLDKLYDLAKFQSFVLTTKNEKQRMKCEYFKWNWKNYFADHSSLKKFNHVYYYKNKVIQEDDIEWNKQVVWYGRRTKKHKADISDLQ